MCQKCQVVIGVFDAESGEYAALAPLYLDKFNEFTNGVRASFRQVRAASLNFGKPVIIPFSVIGRNVAPEGQRQRKPQRQIQIRPPWLAKKAQRLDAT